MIDDFLAEQKFFESEERKILFKEEYDKKIPSDYMWALVLLVHPKSKFSDLDSQDAKQIIYKDYLNSDPKFKWEDYVEVTSKIIESLPSMPQRFLATWKKKLSEINSFLNSQSYNEDTYEMLTKIMKDLHPMMKQYKEIEKLFSEEESSHVKGAIEESLTEKGLI